jgi:hypothetical protein
MASAGQVEPEVDVDWGSQDGQYCRGLLGQKAWDREQDSQATIAQIEKTFQRGKSSIAAGGLSRSPAWKRASAPG